MSSELTDRIQQYADTGKGFDELVDYLAHHTFKVAKRYDDPNTTAQDEADWDHLHVDGSWDEVTAARTKGLITRDEYNTIVLAKHAATRSA